MVRSNVKQTNSNGSRRIVGPARRTRANPIPRRVRVGGGAAGAVQQLPNRGRSTRTVSANGQVQTLSGYDFIRTVEMSNNLTTQTAALLDVGTTPLELAGTRWAQLASMYEKYRFKTLQAVYVPSASSVMGGQMITYFELDPLDSFTLPDVSQMARIAMAHQNAKLHNIYDNVTVDLPTATGLTDFFVQRGMESGFNARFTQQARLRIVATATLSGFYPKDQESVAVGAVYMRYVCEFKNPQIQPNLMVSPPAVMDVVGDVNQVAAYLKPQTGFFALPAPGAPTTSLGLANIVMRGISGNQITAPYSVVMPAGYSKLLINKSYVLDQIIGMHSQATAQNDDHGTPINDDGVIYRFGAHSAPVSGVQSVNSRRCYMHDKRYPKEVLGVQLTQWEDGTLDLLPSAVVPGSPTAVDPLVSLPADRFALPHLIIKALTATASGIVGVISPGAGILLEKILNIVVPEGEEIDLTDPAAVLAMPRGVSFYLSDDDETELKRMVANSEKLPGW